VSLYPKQFARAAYGSHPTWTCLVCGTVFPVLDHHRNLCSACIVATAPRPGGAWEPKTEWGRQRKAERDAARSTEPKP
jgi:hypothetical protein